jgi:hypothetical protein
MENGELEGVVESTERRGNYIYTTMRVRLPKAQLDKLSKSAEYEEGKISGIEAANDAESLITFKKKVKHLKKGPRK